MRKLILSVALLGLAQVGWADIFPPSQAITRGSIWAVGNNGSTATNSYFAGNSAVNGPTINWFEYEIPVALLPAGQVFTGLSFQPALPNTSANQSAAVGLTYTVYWFTAKPGFGSFPGNTFGTHLITVTDLGASAQADSTDAALLAFLNAAAPGTKIYLGGTFNGAAVGKGAFFNTGADQQTLLTFHTQARVPEIDGGSAVAGIALLSGLMTVLRSRRRSS